ncbi:MAG TPA: phage holin family protein [Patescibacteria group bacterium]|nr:phage holin family protein [Patescibacteria group bacterium]
MAFTLSLLIRTLAILVAAYLIPGVQVRNFWVALIVAIVLGLVNIFVRPFILVLTLPINILTLGLFTLVINALMVLLVSAIVPDFQIRDFGSALLFALVLWLINWFLSALVLA